MKAERLQKGTRVTDGRRFGTAVIPDDGYGEPGTSGTVQWDGEEDVTYAEAMTKLRAVSPAGVSSFAAILEVEGHPNGKDVPRYLDAAARLRKAQLGGRRVLYVIPTSDDEPTRVRHFGYDYRCGEEATCPHDPAPWGVLRYFGLTLIVDADESGERIDPLLGMRYKVGHYAQVVLCGCGRPFTGRREPLEEAKEPEVVTA